MADSGAEVSVIPEEFLNLPVQLDAVDDLLTGPGDQSLQVLSSFMATLLWWRESSHQRLFVVKPLSVPQLGFPATQALGVVTFLDDVEIPASKRHFQGLCILKEEYTFQLLFDAEPSFVSVPRRIRLRDVRHEHSELS